MLLISEWARASDHMVCFGCKKHFDPQEITFVVFDDPTGVFAFFCDDCTARAVRTGESPFRGRCPHCGQERPLHWRHDGPQGLDRGCRLCLWPTSDKAPTAHYDICVRCRHLRPTVQVASLDGMDICMECLMYLAHAGLHKARQQLDLVAL